MGMYNHVRYECDCPMCGKNVDGFQTKDGDCQLEFFDPHQANNFYSDCRNCGAWIELSRNHDGRFTKIVRADYHADIVPEKTEIVQAG